MGFLDALLTYFGLKKKEVKVLCIGLDNSGKTTILNKLKPKEVKINTNVVPTIGFTVEMFQNDNFSFITYDMSGQGRYRKLWENYYKDAQAVIFVIDSGDKLRMPVVKDELDLFLAHPEIVKAKAPLLLLANKMDLKNSLSAVACSKQLKLDRIEDRSYHICATNALTGEGLSEAIEWLTDQMKRRNPND